MIVVENLWKRFPQRRDRPGFKELVMNAPKFLKNKNNNKFWALKELNLAVKKGECLGIIGRNGAGKSTLLSLLLGVMRPTRGLIRVNGKKTPLLELGAGFHPDLTGVENIIINGVLLGNTKDEVLVRMDNIIEFSELGDLVDMPVRTYSSGMKMRLAFSIAIHIEPEILLIDEVLSVGDEAFRKKSGDALGRLIKSGVTTVYVSHSMEAVKTICDRVIWLDKGEVKEEGPPDQVVEKYLTKISQKSA